MNISNVTDTFNDSLKSNCTDIENDDDLIIKAMMFVIPSGILFLFLMSIMTYTLIKPLFKKNKNMPYKWRKFYIHLILVEL